jgi:PTH2 family peptidyl-tRNA hydrolase
MFVKQVIVVRKDLKLRRGKEISQSCHASLAFITRRLQKQLNHERGKIVYIEKVDPKNPEKIIKVPSSFLGGRESKKIKDLFSQAELAWMEEIPGEKNFAKIVLQVDSEEALVEVYEKAIAAGLEAHLITDSGATEFHGVPTKTAVGIGPDLAAKIDAVTGDLKLY